VSVIFVARHRGGAIIAYDARPVTRLLQVGRSLKADDHSTYRLIALGLSQRRWRILLCAFAAVGVSWRCSHRLDRARHPDRDGFPRDE